jgi:LysM repeat protein
MLRLALLVSILLLSACGDSLSRGIVITGDGKVGSNNARNQRENAQDTLRIAIEEDLGAGWGVRVAIDEVPTWVEERGNEDGVWRWERMTARVEIVPPLGKQLDESKRAELDRGSRDYLLKKIVKKDPARLALTVQIGVAAAVPVATASTPTGGSRSYTIQDGDTLADISTAFYGTPNHWRAIQQANPGLDPGRLAVGTVIVIPAASAAP